MVNILSIAFMIVTLLICFLLPAALLVYFYRKHKISLIAVLWGAIVFLVSQVAIRIPLLTILGKQQWYMEMSSNIYVIALFLGLTAGLFEEVGRYIVMEFFMKKSLSWKNGIAFGIGHGGIEAMVIVGLTILNYVIMSFMINSGVFESMIAANLPQGVAEQIKSMLVDTPAINFLAGGFERIMTMMIQIALSVIVLYAVKFKKPVYLLYAILLHAVVDTPAVILGNMGLNVWLIELYIAACAAASLIYVIKAKDVFVNKEEEQAAE
ncbi:MAG: hypothetical protein K0Q65_425 [Clostridia bacterium]|jgi:uncharacterized membrane protein YhfC|nr:hypothetical protein [Clostridia bacterium]